MSLSLETAIDRGSDAEVVSGNNSAGTSVGTAATEKVGFYGTTPIVQRSGAAQATSLVGTASSADVTSNHKAALIDVMNTLAAVGLWKGSA